MRQGMNDAKPDRAREHAEYFDGISDDLRMRKAVASGDDLLGVDDLRERGLHS